MGVPPRFYYRCRSTDGHNVYILATKDSGLPSSDPALMDLRTLVDISLLFVVYYAIERIIQLILRARFRTFFDHLLAIGKLRALTAFCLGLFITLISTPFCARACLFVNNSGSVVEPGWDVKMCFTSRIFLLVAELNRIDYDDIYVFHHVGALMAGWFTVVFQMPMHVLLVLFTSLVAEISGDAIWILSVYAASFESPAPELTKFRRALAKLNVVQYAVLRTLGIGLAAWWAANVDISQYATWELLIGWTLMIIHAAFCLWYISQHSRKAWAPASPAKHIFTMHLSHKPPHIRVHTSNFHLGTDIIFTLYGVFMGIGFAFLSAVVLLLIPSPGTLSALPVIQLVAILGARVASLVFEDGIVAFLHSPVTTLLRPGFWLHGGIVGAVIGIYYCHAWGMIDDLWIFSGAMGVALPVYETASRIGCYFYGCCFGRILSAVEIERSQTSWLHLQPVIYASSSRIPDTYAGKPLFPVQLYSAFLFLLLSLGVIPLTWFMSTSFVGFFTIAVHAVIRLHTETHRADYRGAVSWSLSATGKFAVGQLVVGLVGAGIFSEINSNGYVGSKNVTPLSMHVLSGMDMLGAMLITFGMGFTFYGIHRGEIGLSPIAR